MDLIGNSKEGGIPFCFCCVGWHPDEMPTVRDAMARAHNPNRDAWFQAQQFEKKRLTVYAHKSCATCGTTFKPDGTPDDTWDLTARRVKQEFDNAGLFAVDDQKIKLVVAKCRKAVEVLFKNRPVFVANALQKGDWLSMEKMTFAGQLSYIIVVAQEERRRRNGGGTTIRGTLG